MIEETKRISKRTKLFEELEKKFVDEAAQLEEQKRIEKLREIKAMHAPISKEDIHSHARKYDEVLQKKKEELKAKRGFEGGANYDSEERIQNYKSKFYLEKMAEDRE